MKKDLPIREVGDAEEAWLKEALPAGTPQNESARGVREGGAQRALFENSREPKATYANLPFRFIDLFAGIGGFRCGLTAIGGQCAFTSEWNSFAVQTYQSWYGDGSVYTGDIREIDSEKDIPDHDILCAGFPCQPFSLAGVSKKNSLGRAHGFDDAAQGNLFFKVMEVVDKKRPPVIVLENVKNLKSHDKGNTWSVIEKSILERDYCMYSRTINAKYWVPQKRERIFIVCFDKKIFGCEDQIGFQFPEPDRDFEPVLESVLEKEKIDKKYMLSDKLWSYLKNYAAKHKKKGNGFGYGLVKSSGVARTMSARYHKDGSEILIDEKNWRNPRRLTPAEAMRLMGYSKKYSELFGHNNGFPQVVSDTQAYRQFGNSVIPEIVESIGKEIIQCMANVITRTGNGCLLKSKAPLRIKKQSRS